MAIKFPDLLVHNNTGNPLMASTSSKGTAYPINSLNDTGSIDTNKRQEGHIVFVTGSQEFYGFGGTGSGEWDKPENWKKISVQDSQGFTILTQVSESLNFSDDAAAATGGVPLGGLYRSGNFIAIRLS